MISRTIRYSKETLYKFLDRAHAARDRHKRRADTEHANYIYILGKYTELKKDHKYTITTLKYYADRSVLPVNQARNCLNYLTKY